MATILAIPILAVLLILQTAILNKFPLLRGTTDLVMLAVIAWSIQKRVRTGWQWGIIAGLLVGMMSALPFFVSAIIYLIAVGISLLLRRRVWQVPILAMFIATFISTLISHTLTFVALWLIGTPLPFQESLNLITLPSMVLNLLAAIPIYALLSDLAGWLYPEELEG